MKHLFLIIEVIFLLALSSCSISKSSLKEPFAIARYDKAEFDYSPQVEGQASITKILGIDWSHLFNKSHGKVAKSYSSSIYGIIPNTKAEQLALYDLMQKNPGYDFIVYPQYEIVKQAQGLGVFYSNTEVRVRARLARSNDIIVPKEQTSANARKERELKAHLASIQNAYDALLLDNKQEKQNYSKQIEQYQRQLKLAQDQTLEAQKAAYNSMLSEEDLTAMLDADLAEKPKDVELASIKPSIAEKPSKPASKEKVITKQVVTNSKTPPPSSSALSPNHMKESQQVPILAQSYMLVLGSYSTHASAITAQKHLERKYAEYRHAIGTLQVGDKYRVGFINLKTRETAINLRTRLQQNFPECKDAWPFLIE